MIKIVMPCFSPHAVDGGTAGVARGGADDIQAFVPLRQNIFEEVAEKLQRHVLEGQRHAMEQFEDIDAVLLDHRCDLGMAEGGIGTVDQVLERGGGDVVHKGCDDLEGQILIGKCPPAFKLAGGNARDTIRAAAGRRRWPVPS